MYLETSAGEVSLATVDSPGKCLGTHFRLQVSLNYRIEYRHNLETGLMSKY